MNHSSAVIVLMALLFLSTSGEALRTFSGETISIVNPVEDDIFAAGNIVNINAPVDSAVVAGGTVNINAPVKGDVIAAGGQVYGTPMWVERWWLSGYHRFERRCRHQSGGSRGQVSILPGRTVGRDALISAGNAVNSGGSMAQ